jgi:hypothetical protein
MFSMIYNQFDHATIRNSITNVENYLHSVEKWATNSL